MATTDADGEQVSVHFRQSAADQWPSQRRQNDRARSASSGRQRLRSRKPRQRSKSKSAKIEYQRPRPTQACRAKNSTLRWLATFIAYFHSTKSRFRMSARAVDPAVEEMDLMHLAVSVLLLEANWQRAREVARELRAEFASRLSCG
jgi:hypothetical protein